MLAQLCLENCPATSPARDARLRRDVLLSRTAADLLLRID